MGGRYCLQASRLLSFFSLHINELLFPRPLLKFSRRYAQAEAPWGLAIIFMVSLRIENVPPSHI